MADKAFDWMDRSTCRTEKADPRFFIPGSEFYNTKKARSYCGRCSFRSECLGYALATGSVGVWGGEIIEPGMKKSSIRITPVVLITSARPVEFIDNPPALQDHQNPASFL